jgi:hypothetical protein
MAARSQRSPPTAKSAPKMLTRESVFVLRWNIWGTGSSSDRSRVYRGRPGTQGDTPEIA